MEAVAVVVAEAFEEGGGGEGARREGSIGMVDGGGEADWGS